MNNIQKRERTGEWANMPIIPPAVYHLCGCGHEGLSEETYEEIIKPQSASNFFIEGPFETDSSV